MVFTKTSPITISQDYKGPVLNVNATLCKTRNKSEIKLLTFQRCFLCHCRTTFLSCCSKQHKLDHVSHSS